MQDFLDKFGISEQPNPLITLQKETFLTSQDVEKMRTKIERDALSAGLRMGEDGKYFKPSFPLLDWMQDKTTQKSMINEKGEWMFVVGRDVFKDNLLKPTLKGPVLVTNEHDEILGWGVQSPKGIQNKLDRGDYLRREKK